MSGNAQWLVTLLAVAAAASYLFRSAWQTWRGAGGGCGKKCACASTQPARHPILIPPEQLTLRRR